MNGLAGSSQQAISLPVNGPAAVPAPAFPAQFVTTVASEPIGKPSECLLLKNMFDPATEVSMIFLVRQDSLLVLFKHIFGLYV